MMNKMIAARKVKTPAIKKSPPAARLIACQICGKNILDDSRQGCLNSGQKVYREPVVKYVLTRSRRTIRKSLGDLIYNLLRVFQYRGTEFVRIVPMDGHANGLYQR